MVVVVMRSIAALLGTCLFLFLGSRAETAEKSWAFVGPKKPQTPTVKATNRVANPIDAFVLARLEAKGLTLNTPAERLTLLRRVSYDLTGLPPTVAEQEAFLNDKSPDAYRKVVERLLASPRYGERWAQHWLDLVRYAESDGFKADVHRPLAHQYRDYVIKAFNNDLPYDRFVRQQIAGDELEPDNPEALIATGLNRLWPDEDNAANLEQRRQEILDDVTDTMGQVFLGLTVGCARCHDHKYDPTSQADYYQFQSFFSAMLPQDLPAMTPEERKKYEADHAAWEKQTREIRDEIEKLIGDSKRNARKYTVERFNADIQLAVATPLEKRTPYQQQIAKTAERQLDKAEEGVKAKLTGEKKERYAQLEKKLAALPEPQPRRAMMIIDVGTKAPPTHRLLGGNWHRPKEEIDPAFPVFLGGGKLNTSLPEGVNSTGRRAALARWLTRKENPLAARVMVNRLWQHHFGVGIVGSASDFGLMGDAPTHPELLDWLAVEFVENGWSLKHMHRLMVLSSTYQQSSRVERTSEGLKKDLDNSLLWHARRRRLEGEALHDAMLQISGELSLRMHGPSAKPKLPAALGVRYSWTPDPKLDDQNRRSIYVMARRNMRYPLFDVFDMPDQHNPCACRSLTTTAPQALLMLNGDFTQERAQAWAMKLLKQHGSNLDALCEQVYRTAWGRSPRPVEVRIGRQFIETQTDALAGQAMPEGVNVPRGIDSARAIAVIDFCQAVFNTNEFLYVD